MAYLAQHIIYTVEADAQDMCDRMHTQLLAVMPGYNAECFAVPHKHPENDEWKVSWGDHKLGGYKQSFIDDVWTAGEYASIVTTLDSSWNPEV